MDLLTDHSRLDFKASEWDTITLEQYIRISLDVTYNIDYLGRLKNAIIN